LGAKSLNIAGTNYIPHVTGMAMNVRAEEKKNEKGAKRGALGGLLGEVIQKEEGADFIEAIDRADKAEREGKKDIESVLERGKNYRIVQKKGKNLPTYLVSLPKLTDSDKKMLKKIEKGAISQIAIEDEKLGKEELKNSFFRKIMALIESDYPSVPPEKKESIAELIVLDMVGYGLLDPLLSDDSLEEVMLIGTKKGVYVYHRKHGMCNTNIVFDTDEEAGNIIARIARAVGRRVDTSTPLLDARLLDGSRVNATLPPISLDGPTLTIRKFRTDPYTVIDIINFGTLDADVAAFLWLMIEGHGVKPSNILVSGGTGSGKTTTLNCLGSFIPLTDRVLTIEDTAELQLPLEHWIRMETRPPNVEGKGEVNMDQLLRNTLRMGPDRIIVGEVRSEEARTLLTAMNTGQSGCLGTVHANNARETITRLTSAPMNVPSVMIPSLDLILMQNRLHHKGKTVRRITEIAEITGMEGGEITFNVIYEWDPKTDKVRPTGVPSILKHKIGTLRGETKEEVEKEIKRRGTLLRWMVDAKIRGVRKVGRVINDYYIDPEATMQKIQERGIETLEVKKSESVSGEYDFLEAALGAGQEKVLETVEETLVEKGDWYKLVTVEGEKTPVYMLSLPKLSREERSLMKSVEGVAETEIDIDPTKIKDREKAREVFRRKVMEIINSKYPQIREEVREEMTDLIVSTMIGYGPIDLLLKDDDLEEIMVAGTKIPVYVKHRKYEMCKTNIVFEIDEEIERIAGRIASSVGRRIDKSSPLLDARLPDGSRVNATIPPISLGGPTLTIRKFKADPFTVIDVINFNTLNAEVSAYLWFIVEGFGIKPGNILAAGGAGCGKTTTLNCLATFVPPSDRVITIEDTAELRLPIEHCVRLETRPPSVEGTGEVTMDDLVKNTLRMRPDRVIVGEVRGPEAKTLFTAMNTGHDGCMGTVHSNSAKETITRLTNPPMNVPKIMAPALDLILMQSKIFHGGRNVRRIIEIAEVAGLEKDRITLNNVYTWDPKEDTLKPTGIPSVLKQRIAKLKGMNLTEIENEVQKRKKVIEWMVKSKVKGLTGVAEVINRYYDDPKSLLEEIEKRK